MQGKKANKIVSVDVKNVTWPTHVVQGIMKYLNFITCETHNLTCPERLFICLIFERGKTHHKTYFPGQYTICQFPT